MANERVKAVREINYQRIKKLIKSLKAEARTYCGMFREADDKLEPLYQSNRLLREENAELKLQNERLRRENNAVWEVVDDMKRLVEKRETLTDKN